MALVDHIGRDGFGAAITFAGQGLPALDRLVECLEIMPDLRALVAPAAAALRDLGHSRAFRWSGLADHGCDPLGWIDAPETRPPLAYLTSTVISQPIILMAQIARFELTRRQGLSAAFDRGGVRALTGHSQGVMAAVLVAESQRGIVSAERLAMACRWMLWQGLHMAESALDAGPAADRTPMAAVSGFTHDQLETLCAADGADRPPAERAHITLHNGRTRFVLSGHPATLDRVHRRLEATVAAQPKAGPRRLPSRFTWEWLDVGGPFHSPLMGAGYRVMLETAAREGLRFDASDLVWPVLDPACGRRLDQHPDLTAALIETQFMRPVQWSATARRLADGHGADVVIDCGPGDGVARLTRGALRGAGVPVVAVDTATGQEALFTIGAAPELPVRYADFAPRLARMPGGELVVDNRYTRITGQSPVILPGMTPTTVDVPIVAAAADAGFTAELAGGGQVTEAILERRLAELADAVAPGVAATFNALYLDRYLWDLHLGGKARVIDAARRGAPLCGVTISAGIPPLDEAVALLDRLHDAGLWLNALKPGTVEQMDRVLRIAATRPTRPLFVHLEGGKAGGHHSWEDLDDLLLGTYHKVRAVPNVVLCVGGGVGDEARCAALLTGQWARRHGLPDMPVDAVFLGTVTMACAEATASAAVKAALVAAAGTERWVPTGAVDGQITSGRSGLNAEIHYLENAAARCGRLLDAVAGDAEAVAARRAEIVDALNATARPYFGDLEGMTWSAAVDRLVELMAIGRHGPYEDGAWADRTWRERVADFVRLAEARLVRSDTAESLVDADLRALDDPEAFAAAFVDTYPDAAHRTVHPADARAFVGRICARPGKPVPFVPVIDADVRRWYKADSLWAAQDERFAADQVLVIPGPDAVRGIRRADEPVAEVLARFEAGAVAALEAAGVEPAARHQRHGPARAGVGETHVELHARGAGGPWFERIAAAASPALAAALTAERIAVGRRRVDNPVHALCAPVPGATLAWSAADEGAPAQVVWTDARSGDRVTLTERADGGFDLLFETAPVADDVGRARLLMRFDAGPTHGAPTPYLDPDGLRDALRDCYLGALFAGEQPPTPLFETARARVTVDAARARGYARLTGHPAGGGAPACFAFSVAWPALFSVVSCDELAAGLLRLVHLDQSVEPGPAWPLVPGEDVDVEARLVDLEQTPTGVVVRVEARIARDGAECARLDSGFFIRNGRVPGGASRLRRQDVRIDLEVPDAAAARFLGELDLIALDAPLAAGDRVRIEAHAHEERRPGRAVCHSTGDLLRGGQVVGRIAHRVEGAARHPLDVLVETLGGPAGPRRVDTPPRTRAQAAVRAPARLDAFAEVGRDHNPIHRSPAFARMAGLPGVIVHGMWTAARLHGFVVGAAGGDAGRVADWRVEFIAPIAPGARLELTARRVAMVDGALVIEATAAAEDGPVVARARATVKPRRTAYVFPGQGIQQQGMGMAQYAASPAARAVWDRADAVTRARLGFSILRLVRDNPREVIVDGERLAHPKGVLHLTRFTQPAMAVLAMAQMAALREAGVVVADAVTAGHSVGEYNALAAVVEVLPLESVVEIVYQRGCVMHRFVPRDAQGRSAYRMGVIRPHHAGMDHAAAEALVAAVAERTGRFLQIVNYNVRGRQYAVTGHHAALAELAAELMAKQRPDGRPPYVEVPGIDVPFHSSVLRDGVDAFRSTLQTCLPATIDPVRLVDRYVPNLVARPFALTRDFAEAIVQACGSPIVTALLRDWPAAAAEPATLARTLLVELLAWQFASPVRWIETQDLLVGGPHAVERVVEVGVGYQPTVANMLRSTVRSLGDAAPSIEVLNAEADGPRVTETDVDPVIEVLDGPAAEPVVAETPAPAAPTPSAPAATPSTPPPADAPVAVPEALRTLLAMQARVRPEQLDDTETLDGLFEGVSSRRNQALVDLGAEFEPGAMDAAHEMPLATLADTLAERAGRYAHPGDYLRAAQDAALRSSMGRAGFGRSEVGTYLGETYGLGPGLVAAALDVLALETRPGASSRGGDLGQMAGASAGDPAAARALLDQVVEHLGTRLGRPIARRDAGAAGGGTVDAAAVAALEDRISGPDGVLMGLARDLMARLGGEAAEAPAAPLADDAQARVDAEHGAGYLDQISARFDARQHIAFTTAGAFARRDVARLYYDAVNGRAVDFAARIGRLAAWSADQGVIDTALYFHKLAEDRAVDGLRGALEAIAAGRGIAPAPVKPARPSLAVTADGPRYAEAHDPAAPDLAAFVAGLGDAVSSPAIETLRVVWTDGARSPLPFAGRTAVVSGASPGSIAVEVVRHLLRGGARVVVTTTTTTRARRRFYRSLYRAEAGPGAELHVVPCNMGSMVDIDALVDWLFDTVTEQSGAVVRTLKPAFAPDLLLPFGAVGDAATVDRLGTRSHVALRVLLLGVERLIGAIATRYRQQGLPRDRCHVVLPLSPNHGAFGGDGVYAETKAALEVLVEKWHSERDAWGEATTLCAARIGWVRGTGLMDANNPVAARLEERTAVRTFSAAEMGFLLAGTCADAVRRIARDAPVRVDLTGGFGAIPDLRETVSAIRADIDADVRHARRLLDLHAALDPARPATPEPVPVQRAPVWPAEAPDAQPCPWPETRLDPAQTVVIVGRGEVGPCGTDRTRFELEIGETLSPASVLELAWMCGLVRWQDDARGGGWIDVESDAPVAEQDIAALYHDAVRSRAGIRWIEPELAGYDAEAVPVHATVFLDRDFSFPVGDEAEARAFEAADPQFTRVACVDGTWTVTRRSGSEVKVLRHARLPARIAGLVPTGFDFTRYGLPVDMVERVDRVALFNLVATVDAFLSAGLEPETLLAHVHPARVANTQGAGIGGMASLRRLYQDHLLGEARQGDVLQETLINVAAAYVVQGYVGSYGAMSHPVGACATAAVSLEEGLDKILAGKADVVVAGGFDDIGPEGAVGFADMGATADTDTVRAMGLDPDEVSRANDARRRGFVEAHGGGTTLLTRGDIARDLGLPVLGVLAWAGSFGDGIQVSIPAPGMGALAAAMGGVESPLGRALTDHGLTADDVALVYKHDTSTAANDVNENALHHRIQGALGRTPGNPLFAVSQKTLTGHSKGGAAAWQLGGLCQALSTGRIPGNRNLDELDPAMLAYGHVAFTDETLEPGAGAPMRAGLLTSLGFGHVSAVALVLHPAAFEATLDDAAREAWRVQVAERQRWARRRRAAILMGEVPHYARRSHRRFAAPDGSDAQSEQESALLLDADMRLDPATGHFTRAGAAR